MADAAELEFLRRTLVEPGLLAPDRLDAWRLGWSGRGSFFAHLVELGALARADAGTLGAVFKGYVRMPPSILLGLFKLDVQPVGDAVGAVAPAELRSAVTRLHGLPGLTAAIVAALSGLPMEAAEKLPARAPADFEDMSRETGDDQI